MPFVDFLDGGPSAHQMMLLLGKMSARELKAFAEAIENMRAVDGIDAAVTDDALIDCAVAAEREQAAKAEALRAQAKETAS